MLVAPHARDLISRPLRTTAQASTRTVLPVDLRVKMFDTAAVSDILHFEATRGTFAFTFSPEKWISRLMAS
jgi:hypothetical protein